MPITVKIIWKQEEDDLLIALRKAGYNNEQIGKEVGRPRSTVGHRLTRLLGNRSEQEIGAVISAVTRISTFWTPEKDAELISMREAGKSYKAIGDRLGCGHTTVFSRLCKLQFLPKHVPSPKVYADEFWTDELFARIDQMRSEGMSIRLIGEKIGRHESTICEHLRLRKPAQEAGTTPKHGGCRADFFRRPTGPIPKVPDASPSPRAPAYRRCLGDECGRVFWSASAAVRICPRCKGGGNETVRGGSAEYRLML
jgi:transposase